MSHNRENAVTAVLTSCGRFDLLERAIRSFIEHNTAPLARFLLMEDSGSNAARDIAAAIDPGIEVMVGQRGQLGSIDHAYGTVQTPYIFHFEDDYIFLRGGFIEESLTLLEKHDWISMVSARRWHHTELNLTPVSCEGIEVFLPPPSAHPGWFGYAFHTGLRRKREWQRFGPFKPYDREWDVSYAMKRAGLRMAYLAEAASYDSDDGVSVSAVDPARKRNGIGKKKYKLKKSLKKGLFVIERALGRYDRK